jgi:hypothetical protein
VGTRNAVPPYITPTTLSDSRRPRFGPHTHYEYSHDTLRVRDVQAGNKIGGKSGINWAALDKGERGVSKHAHALALALKPSTPHAHSCIASRPLCRPHTHMHISQSRRTMCIRTPHTFVFHGRCFAASSH